MKEYDETLNTIRNLIQPIKKMYSDVMPIIKKDIADITKNNKQSPQHIEEILDTLLSAMDFGVGEKEFLKLNKYYSTFNKENAAAYKKYYNEWKNQ